MGLLNSPSAEVYRTWADGLSDLSESAIRFGLRRARDFRGFFNLPAFRELCHVKPEDMGLPDARSAYLEAAKADGPKDRIRWSHSAVYHAGCETGWFELRNLTERECFPLYERNYSAMCKRVLAGERLDMPVQRALPESIPQYLTTEENKARLAKLKEIIA